MTPDQGFTDNPTYAWDGLTPPYRTIVVDPPWEYPEDCLPMARAVLDALADWEPAHNRKETR